MRLLYIQANFGFGGINQITSVKENYLVEHGYEVHNLNTAEESLVDPNGMYSDKICFHSIFKRKLDHLNNIKYIGRVLRYFYFRIKFFLILCKVRPNIIISTQPILEPLSIIYFTFWIRRILEFQGWYNGTKKENLTRQDKWYSKSKYHFYHIVSLTSREAQYVEYLTGNKSLYINNANYMPFGKPSNCESKQVTIIARLSPEKGISEFLPSWIRVEKKHPDWKLCIYGQGDEKEKIMAVINEHNINNVEVHPYTRDVVSVYRNSSIFLLPSRFEGWGLTLIESMTLGVPCIAYDCPFGPSEIIHDSEDGFLTEYLNPDAMVDKINFLIENPDRRKAMGGKARINVQRFNIDQIMGQWMHLFENLMYGKFLQPPTI